MPRERWLGWVGPTLLALSLSGCKVADKVPVLSPETKQKAPVDVATAPTIIGEKVQATVEQAIDTKVKQVANEAWPYVWICLGGLLIVVGGAVILVRAFIVSHSYAQQKPKFEQLRQALKQ